MERWCGNRPSSMPHRNTILNSSPLAVVQRHHLHAVFPFLGLAFAGFERGMRKEGLEWRQFLGIRASRDRVGIEAARGGDQFVQVLDPRLTLVLLVLAVVLDQGRCSG